MATTAITKYLTPGEFARRLKEQGVTRSVPTIRSWCNKGLPGARRIGHAWEIDESTVKLVMDGEWSF